MRKLLLLSAVLLSLTACETDSYEKGQGKYSLMRADLADMYIDGEKTAVAFVTDDGDDFQLTNSFTAKWIATADTTYRLSVYYNKVDNKRAEVIGLNHVATIRPLAHWRLRKQPQDPVGVESAWVVRNGRYLNLGLLFKSGRMEDDEEGSHTIGLAQDTVLVNADGKRTAYYRFLHDQGDTPQYYTNRRYVSILLPEEQRPDSVSISVNTFAGTYERKFAL